MRVNPILARELRQRMRGKRVVFMLTMYLVLVTALLPMLSVALAKLMRRWELLITAAGR